MRQEKNHAVNLKLIGNFRQRADHKKYFKLFPIPRSPLPIQNRQGCGNIKLEKTAKEIL